MATTAAILFRLNLRGRAVMLIAARLARVGLRVPHSWVVAITNRSWQMQSTAGRWQPIRIDNRGRITR